MSTDSRRARFDHLSRTLESRSPLDGDLEVCAGCGASVPRAFRYALCDTCLAGVPVGGNDAIAQMTDDYLQLAEDLGLIEPVFEAGSDTVPLPDTDNVDDELSLDIVNSEFPGIGKLSRRSTSREWGQGPLRMEDESHFLSDINEDYQLAFCSAHGYRVRINIRDRRNGNIRWRCAEKNLYNQQAHR